MSIMNITVNDTQTQNTLSPMPNLSSITFYGDALQVGARAAKLTAANIANSDTPGYKARGINFDQALQARLNGDTPAKAEYERGLPTGLDGNDVSLDHESVQSAANAQRMRESLSFLQGDTKSLITALRPQGKGGGG